MSRATKKDGSVMILVAVIGLFGTLGAAFFAIPAFQAWIGSLFTPAGPDSLEVQAITPLDVFSYAGNDNPQGGWSGLSLSYDEENIPIYDLEYFLPTDKYGYAGLAFRFWEGENLSAYEAVECVILFGKPSEPIELYFKDIAEHFNTLRVVDSGANEMALRYEFTNFPDINFNAVQEFGIVLSTDFSTGSHEVSIKNVRFVK